MELRQLRYFKAVSDARSFVGGSHYLRVAQPALSRSIAKLEQELGQSLFVRHSGGVTLTDAGVLFYKHVKTIFQDMRRLTDEMAADMNVPHGLVSLGAPASMQSILTAPVAAAFVKRFPDAELMVLQNASAPLRDGVASGQVDVAVISTNALARGVHYEPLLTLNFCLICPADMAEQFGDSVGVNDLVDLPLILCGYPDTLRTYLDEAFSHVAAIPKVRCEVNTGSLVLDLVLGGAGLGIVPSGVLPNDRRDLAAVPIRDLQASWVVATSFDRVGSAAVRRLTQMLVDHVRDLADGGMWPTARFDGRDAVEAPIVDIAPHLMRQFSARTLGGSPLGGAPAGGEAHGEYRTG